MQRIAFTVTTDLNYDQRMMKICSAMQAAGYEVILIGRKMRKSQVLTETNYTQKRLTCFFEKGKLFYAEYNLRLFFYLLFLKCDCICAIDLDSIIAVYYASKIRKKKRVYDAHELFCEMKEIVTRPGIYKIWKGIERKFVPKFNHGYTVNEPIAAEFKKMYQSNFIVIRNIARQKKYDHSLQREKIILYQGAVNEGRCFETLIPAMKWVNAKLIICGDGNFLNQTKALVAENQLNEKVVFYGMVQPAELQEITRKVHLGLTLVENKGLSNYYSLANRFFDYIQGFTPQVCVNFPVYAALNIEYEVAKLIDDTSSHKIAEAINELLENDSLWNRLQQNCIEAAKVWNWENESKSLIKYYKEVVFQ